ncbi:BSD domain-containing protein 1-like [Dorcoceras hygrometricum]|uniref:BSD domain-containing protein 1-like n=1 Tax=Dorcoceras hygrometricum TaxID=472368 RepID=A0A2Z7BEE5_9LAMI|nr:BSD domain-containing protein 1-like [Dorcoceras hygrometricum]
MNFFKSILSDDPDPPKSDVADPNPAAVKPPHDDRHGGDVTHDDPADGWSLGGLMKTISTRSESVMETYRRDLMEFGLGLKKETEIIRDAASRAVKDLPASLEAGASAAQGALDGVMKSTADIISKETKNFMSDGESETPETNRSLNTGRYSRFEAQLSAIQSDFSTFCEEPEDVEEYKRWKLGFQLNERTEEIEGLIGDDGVLESVYRKIVPREVDEETFWSRYFYRVDKLKQQERVRANLVKRAIAVDDEEEELSWDVEDDEDGASGSESVVKAKGGDEKGGSNGSLKPLGKLEDSNGVLRDDKETKDNVNDGSEDEVVESSKKSVKEPSLSENELKCDEAVEVKRDGDVKNEQIVENNNEKVENKNNEKVGAEVKGETSEHGKGNDVSLVSSHKSKVEEEDLEWDEIEDVGSGDEKKFLATSRGERPKPEDMRKKLSATEDDEDLNWDIEDDDEPAKA